MIQLGMFAKYWLPGEVKTRLAKSIGAVPAAQLYRACLECSLARFTDFSARRLLSCTPWEHNEAFSQLLPTGWSLKDQGQGDLGQRMRRYFEQFRADATQPSGAALLIGSDTPTLPMERLRQAAAALDSNSVVLGPSEDGGYYLIGVRKCDIQPELMDTLFLDMPWSEPALLPESIHRLKRRQVATTLLEPWYDVDDWQSLEKLQTELRREQSTEPRLRELQAKVAAVCGK